MEILEATKQRRSIRQFQRRALPPQVLDTLNDAVRWAPSAGNLQSRRFWRKSAPCTRDKVSPKVI